MQTVQNTLKLIYVTNNGSVVFLCVRVCVVFFFLHFYPCRAHADFTFEPVFVIACDRRIFMHTLNILLSHLNSNGFQSKDLCVLFLLCMCLPCQGSGCLKAP